MHFFSNFDFEPGSRMTGIWMAGQSTDTDAEMVALASLVDFGPEQHGELEANFLASHLPFHFGGFEGVGPDGRAFAVMIQVAPVTAAEVVGGDPCWPMSDGLDRALHYNWQASLREESGYTRDQLLRLYQNKGIDLDLVQDWSFGEFMLGLLAECCLVSLEEIVVGRIAQCAFPQVDHECEHDVFRDVFAMWSTGSLNPPEPDSDADDHFEEGFFWPEEELDRMTTKELRDLARLGSWDKSLVRSMRRKALIVMLATPSWFNAESAPLMLVNPD